MQLFHPHAGKNALAVNALGNHQESWEETFRKARRFLTLMWIEFHRVMTLTVFSSINIKIKLKNKIS